MYHKINGKIVYFNSDGTVNKAVQAANLEQIRGITKAATKSILSWAGLVALSMLLFRNKSLEEFILLAVVTSFLKAALGEYDSRMDGELSEHGQYLGIDTIVGIGRYVLLFIIVKSGNPLITLGVVVFAEWEQLYELYSSYLIHFILIDIENEGWDEDKLAKYPEDKDIEQAIMQLMGVSEEPEVKKDYVQLELDLFGDKEETDEEL